MAKEPRKEEFGEVKVTREIDPNTGFGHTDYILPAGPPPPPPPPGPNFLQRHPYFGPIIGAIVGAIIVSAVSIILFLCGKR